MGGGSKNLAIRQGGVDFFLNNPIYMYINVNAQGVPRVDG